jgi:[ribosomal protein S18]-alanine N-acetyltransferase
MDRKSVSGEFTVRELEARDVPILRASLAEWVPGHWSSSGIENALASTHQFRVLAFHVGGKEELAGIAEYQQIVDEGHLLGIAIVPAMQRRGLGMKLLLAVLEEMRGEGCRRCLLEVRRSNSAGQALYQRAQFKLDGTRKDYYPPLYPGQPREDALLFSRPL